MAASENQAAQQLRKISQCSICLNDFTDPRMLACIHTFCFECLKRVGEATEKKPGEKMPCPLCRKDFTIPDDGMYGIQRNFFMQDLMDVTNMLRQNTVSAKCDTCKDIGEGECDSGNVPEATMRCLECRDNFCDRCSKIHQVQKLSRCHKVVKIGSETEEEIRRIISVKACTKHTQKLLDYYCIDCKKIVCVSCFVESHKSHDCKDVSTVDEEFRQTIQNKAWKISTYMNEMLLMRNNNEKRKADFLKELVDKETDIHKRNQELKDMIDRHTKSLLDELSVIKSKHLKEMENQMEEIERYYTILRSFEAYCNELRLKGSASDICSSVHELIVSANELEKDHKAFIGHPLQSVEVSFQATDLKEVLRKFNNILGNIQAETTTQFKNCVIVVGINDGKTITKDVIKINLHRPLEISAQEQIPTTMKFVTVAAVYCNTMYVSGIGARNDEIWKYNFASGSGWMKCASLVQGRCRHSAAFIDEVLYICGGFVDSGKSVLDSVEAYNAVSNKCTTSGKLVHCVQNSGNCVPFRGSLYIFGGADKDYKALNNVQVYNTKENTCSLLSKPMPDTSILHRAIVWQTSVILLGHYTCFIYNIETETWQERNQFKTDAAYFGMVLENERVFVIGGGDSETDKDGKTTWKCRDDVRSVPLQNIIDDKPSEWKIHGKLPKPSLIQVYEKLTFCDS